MFLDITDIGRSMYSQKYEKIRRFHSYLWKILEPVAQINLARCSAKCYPKVNGLTLSPSMYSRAHKLTFPGRMYNFLAFFREYEW